MPLWYDWYFLNDISPAERLDVTRKYECKSDLMLDSKLGLVQRLERKGQYYV